MRLNFNSYDAVGLLETMETDLGIDMNTTCQRTEFPLPKQIGEGVISTYLFKDGFSLFLFNGTLHHDWEWEFTCKETSPALLFFSLSGAVMDVKKGEKDSFVLKPLETLLVVQPGGSDRSMVFKKDIPISLAVFRLDHEKYFDKKACCPEDLPERLRVLLSLSGAEIRCLMPPDRSTPETSQLVKDIMSCPFKGLVRTCIVEAKARQFLALIMQRLESDLVDPSENARMAKVDMQKIHEARDILVSDLQNPPTIEELARKMAMNRQKLKQDFKFVFEKTIYQYLIHKRMQVAKKLMLEQNIPVQEVAKKVGYENASHFSKRFKGHFDMLPSKFLAMVWRTGQDN